MVYRYFYDCEFIEDGRTVDLVSIGVVDEYGREFYAVSTEFDDSRAVPWVRRNVLDKLPSPADRAWRSRERIRDDLYDFLRGAGAGPAGRAVGAVGLVRRVRPCGAGPALGGDAGAAPGDPPVHQGAAAALGRPGPPAGCPTPTPARHDALVDARHNLARWRAMTARDGPARFDRFCPGHRFDASRAEGERHEPTSRPAPPTPAPGHRAGPRAPGSAC